MKKNNVFRKVSIERLSSPEQLDQLLQVVHPRGWVALSGFGLIIIALIIWGVLGSVPTKVSGQGVLIRSGGVSEIIASGRGRIADLAVRAGDVVQAGQVIARISHPDLEKRLEQAEAKLDELQSQKREIQQASKREMDLRLQNLRQRRETLTRALQSDEEQIAWLKKKIEARKELLREGLITQQMLVDTQQQLRTTQKNRADKQAQIQQIGIEHESIISKFDRDSTSRTFDIHAQQRLVDQYRDELDRKSRVVSDHQGRVIEMRAEPGDLVDKGQPLASFSRIGREVKSLTAVLYVSARNGKKVEPGMTVQISPSTVEPEEYGRMLGIVTYVSDYPATSKGMMQLLGNDQLVETLGAGGAPYELHADLLPAPDTESGYEWTSSGGPPTKIQTGTLCQSRITTLERRPAELVLPTLRRLLGS